jgi:hypothetical protein
MGSFAALAVIAILEPQTAFLLKRTANRSGETSTRTARTATLFGKTSFRLHETVNRLHQIASAKENSNAERDDHGYDRGGSSMYRSTGAACRAAGHDGDAVERVDALRFAPRQHVRANTRAGVAFENHAQLARVRDRGSAEQRDVAGRGIQVPAASTNGTFSDGAASCAATSAEMSSTCSWRASAHALDSRSSGDDRVASVTSAMMSTSRGIASRTIRVPHQRVERAADDERARGAHFFEQMRLADGVRFRRSPHFHTPTLPNDSHSRLAELVRARSHRRARPQICARPEVRREKCAAVFDGVARQAELRSDRVHLVVASREQRDPIRVRDMPSVDPRATSCGIDGLHPARRVTVFACTSAAAHICQGPSIRCPNRIADARLPLIRAGAANRSIACPTGRCSIDERRRFLRCPCAEVQPSSGSAPAIRAP